MLPHPGWPRRVAPSAQATLLPAHHSHEAERRCLARPLEARWYGRSRVQVPQTPCEWPHRSAALGPGVGTRPLCTHGSDGAVQARWHASAGTRVYGSLESLPGECGWVMKAVETPEEPAEKHVAPTAALLSAAESWSMRQLPRRRPRDAAWRAHAEGSDRRRTRLQPAFEETAGPLVLVLGVPQTPPSTRAQASLVLQSPGSQRPRSGRVGRQPSGDVPQEPTEGPPGPWSAHRRAQKSAWGRESHIDPTGRPERELSNRSAMRLSSPSLTAGTRLRRQRTSPSATPPPSRPLSTERPSTYIETPRGAPCLRTWPGSGPACCERRPLVIPAPRALHCPARGDIRRTPLAPLCEWQECASAARIARPSSNDAPTLCWPPAVSHGNPAGEATTRS